MGSGTVLFLHLLFLYCLILIPGDGSDRKLKANGCNHRQLSWLSQLAVTLQLRVPRASRRYHCHGQTVDKSSSCTKCIICLLRSTLPLQERLCISYHCNCNSCNHDNQELSAETCRAGTARVVRSTGSASKCGCHNRYTGLALVYIIVGR